MYYSGPFRPSCTYPPGQMSAPETQNDIRTSFIYNLITVNNVYRSTRMSNVDFYHLTLCLGLSALSRSSNDSVFVVVCFVALFSSSYR